MMKNLLFLLLSAVLTGAAQGEEREFLTIDKLLQQDFVQLNGEQLYDLMHKNRIEVTDIETDRVLISDRGEQAGMQRKFEAGQSEHKVGNTKGSKKALYFLDTRLLARAPKLDGKIERRIVDDAIVATDGTRTYHFRVYRKGEQLFAARDIDNGNVYYRVKVK